MIKKNDIVSVNFHNSQITLSENAKVLSVPMSPGESWIFEDLFQGLIHYVSEGCTVTKIKEECDD